MTWRERAKCLTEDPDLFFPIGTSMSASFQLTRAKKVCSECEVRLPCLQWAIDQGIEHGVWGGLSEDERRSLKRRSARTRIRAVSFEPPSPTV